MSLPNDTGRHSGEDALLSSVLRAAGGVEAGGCPDAEVIGLFAERALAGAELRAVETHVAGCPRCQATVAAFVRALPDDAAEAAAGARETSAGGTAAGGGFGGWFAGWRWLVPATSLAAVALVAVWVGRGPADQVAESARGPAGMAETDAAAPSAGPAASPAPEAFARETTPPPPGNATVGAADARAKTATSAEARRTGAASGEVRREASAAQADRAASANMAGASTVGASAARGARVDTAPADGRTTAPVQETLSVTQAPAAPAAASIAAPAPAPAPAEAATAAAGPARAVATDAAAGAARPRAAASAEKRAEPGAVLGANDAITTTRPPAVSFRLRAGALERSADRGATWQRAVLPAGVTVVAIASPAPGVCWAVAADAVLRTTDGATFTREPVPTTERLTGITATDAMHAVVTSASGARFATANGGRTWTPAP